MEITVINAVLTGTILLIGIWNYRKNGDEVSIYIGGAFGLFFASHILTLFGAPVLDIPIILIRLLGYLVVGIMLYTRLNGTTR